MYKTVPNLFHAFEVCTKGISGICCSYDIHYSSAPLDFFYYSVAAPVSLLVLLLTVDVSVFLFVIVVIFQKKMSLTFTNGVFFVTRSTLQITNDFLI